ncbi:MAG: hypothetical protein CMJ58_01130 [Planctomycetaceae bacterium]|nr:hypothetical protein [Planctomycetaceae bacterium]
MNAASGGDKESFHLRAPGEQEAILANLFCERCRRLALAPQDFVEIENDGVVVVEATCMRCESRVRLALDDIP